MVKRAYRFYYDFEKEEAWLNEMARQGWMMNSFFLGVYQFTEGAPGEYIYRIELLPQHARSLESLSYLRFLEEAGVEIVTTWFRWAIYRRKASEGAFDIFSDIDSRISLYRRVSRFLFPISIFEWWVALMQGGNLINALNPHGSSQYPLGFSLFFFLFCALIGIGMFRAAWRSYKNYKRLEKEKQLRE